MGTICGECIHFIPEVSEESQKFRDNSRIALDDKYLDHPHANIIKVIGLTFGTQYGHRDCGGTEEDPSYEGCFAGSPCVRPEKYVNKSQNEE